MPPLLPVGCHYCHEPLLPPEAVAFNCHHFHLRCARKFPQTSDQCFLSRWAVRPLIMDWIDANAVVDLTRLCFSNEQMEKAVMRAAELGRRVLLGQLLDMGVSISEWARGRAVNNTATIGDLKGLMRLLKDGEISDDDRGLALIAAAMYDHQQCLVYLLKKGQFSMDYLGTAINQAAKIGSKGCLDELLRFCRQPVEIEDDASDDEERKEPAGVAHHRASSPIVARLMKIPDSYRGPAFESASSGGHFECLKALRMDGSIPPFHMEEAVINAAKLDRLDMLEWLLEFVTLSDRARGAAILAAAMNGSLECLKKLIESGGGISESDRYRAAHNAISKNHFPCLNYLLQVPLSNESYEELVCDAAMHGRIECLSLLLLNKTISSEKLGEAVRYAAGSGEADCLRVLLQRGITLADRAIAIIKAAESDQTDCLDLLLEADGISIKQLAEAARVAEPISPNAYRVLLRELQKHPAGSIDDKGIALIGAAFHGDLTRLNQLLTVATFSKRDLEKALFEAASNGHSSCVERLLELPEITLVHNLRAGQIAKKNNHSDCQLALANRFLVAVVRASVEDRGLALFEAASIGNEGLIEFLTRGDLPSKVLENSFMAAVKNNHMSCIKQLLKKHRFSLQALKAAESFAIQAIHADCARLLGRYQIQYENSSSE